MLKCPHCVKQCEFDNNDARVYKVVYRSNKKVCRVNYINCGKGKQYLLKVKERVLSDLQKKILVVLKENGKLTRKELCKKLDNVPRTTVFDSLKTLQHHFKLVDEVRQMENLTRSRPLEYWEVIKYE